MASRAGKPVTRISGFWDSSALVPLCVRQSITPQVLGLYKNYDVVVWWATPVEITSALARLLRMKQIDTGDYAKACKLAKDLFDSWSVIQPSDSLLSRAIQIAERYDLRAADSLQLAAAMEWCSDNPKGRVFLTTDQKLLEAALLGGFDAKRV